MAAGSILAGIKTAAVINVGTATLGALIGAGGYGQPILTGIRLDDVGLILQGALPAAGRRFVVVDHQRQIAGVGRMGHDGVARGPFAPFDQGLIEALARQLRQWNRIMLTAELAFDTGVMGQGATGPWVLQRLPRPSQQMRVIAGNFEREVFQAVAEGITVQIPPTATVKQSGKRPFAPTSWQALTRLR